MFKTTAWHAKYWSGRRIDWKQSYFDTHDHPHRFLITDMLRKWRHTSILEIGCASGANLYRIQKDCPWMEFGGVDISKDAIEEAKRQFPNCALLTDSSFDDLFMSDKSTDIILTDMTLIYADPVVIHRVIKEIKRVVRNRILFVEFHSESFMRRLLLRVTSGYHAYDYRKLLLQYGFYDIQTEKIPESLWPGGEPQKEFAYVISARL